MSKIYIILLATAGLLISVTGAVFSIAGLSKLFAGAAISVMFMAASLEFAKVVVAGFLYRYWGHVNQAMRIYLSAAVAILVCITSLGIFGYLSNAYQKSSLILKTETLKIENLKADNQRVLTEIEATQKFIDEIPQNRISKKFELHKDAQPRIRQLRQRSDQLVKQIEDAEFGILNIKTEVGPLIYVAEAFHTNVDTVAKFLIMTFVAVFDPLAICLIFAWGLAVRLRQKYRGDERRISNLAISKPVDHRFKKIKKVAKLADHRLKKVRKINFKKAA